MVAGDGSDESGADSDSDSDSILGSEGRNAEAECCLNIITRQLHRPARARSQARLQLNRCRCRTFIQMGN